MKIGYTTENSKDHFKQAKIDGCNIVQIFTSNPSKLTYSNDNFDTTSVKHWDGEIVIHSSFLINLCRPKFDKISINSRHLLKNDLKTSKKINAIGVVVHMGKNTGNLSYEKAYDTYIDNINTVLSETNDGIIILETGAGVGSEVSTKLNELGKIRDKVNPIHKHRIKYCIDTCHIYAAGYDLANECFVDTLETYIENTLKWENVVLLHCNDSKTKFNSKKDIHADISSGIISCENFKSFLKFINFFKKRNIPIILETPSDTINYSSQIDMIKQLDLLIA